LENHRRIILLEALQILLERGDLVLVVLNLLAEQIGLMIGQAYKLCTSRYFFTNFLYLKGVAIFMQACFENRKPILSGKREFSFVILSFLI